MRDRELELIAALVEGRLDHESEARALIEANPELREEYEAQVLAFGALTAMGSVSLSETERSSLHRDVWTALRHQPAASPKGQWYVRMAAAAAGLFVVVGLAAVLSSQGGPDDDGFAEIAAGVTESDASDGGDDDDADDEADARVFEDSAETTVAAAEEPAAGALSATYFAQEAAAVRSGEFTSGAQSYDDGSSGDVGSCLQQAGLEGHVAIVVLTPPPEETGDADGESRLIAAVPEGSQLAEAPVAFVDMASCRLIHIEED
ncbi:MAG TPA: hypothetical protein VMP13_07625 [Acidimicrobiia bacterium]|nr:hypothetical protein [Acidimicrobiia bacterium]